MNERYEGTNRHEGCVGEDDENIGGEKLVWPTINLKSDIVCFTFQSRLSTKFVVLYVK